MLGIDLGLLKSHYISTTIALIAFLIKIIIQPGLYMFKLKLFADIFFTCQLPQMGDDTITSGLKTKDDKGMPISPIMPKHLGN